MTKNVAINSATPAPKIATAEGILGKVIEPVKTRWSPGSLLASAIGLVSEPVLAILTSSYLVIIRAINDLPSELLGVVSTGLGDESYNSFLVQASPGSSSRTRPLDPASCGGYLSNALIDYSSAEIGVDSVLLDLLCLPVLPTYTIGSLASKVDSYYQDREAPAPYTFAVAQDTGSAVIGDGVIPLGTLLSALSNEMASFIAIYDLTVPDGAVVVPDTTPIWG